MALKEVNLVDGCRVSKLQLIRLRISRLQQVLARIEILPVCLHTGINNIKIHNSHSCKSHADGIERKCDEIFSVYPKCKIFLSLVLPTKLDLLNRRVREFNNMLLDLAHNYRRINIIETSSVADRYGILIDEFGRFDKWAGKCMDHDILHLGIRGLRIFAKSVKDAVINSRKRNTGNINSSQVVQGYQGQGRPAGPNHSKRGQSLPLQSQR